MSVAYAVRNQCRKLAQLGSLFRRQFNSSKCKTWAKMTTARIKLLRNKRETTVRQMRRDIALLLQSGQDATARIRVEHVIREQNMMAANEILELFCERIVTRLSIIAKRKECPADVKEAISSLIFAGPRCSDIPELLAIRDILLKKYGKDFVSAATDLRPNSGVNRLLIEKLSALNPTGELKLKVMKEIAKEYQVEWDTTETEMELLKPPEERIEGTHSFVSASSLPINRPSSGGGGIGSMDFQDAASAAKAAADSAKNAIAAAQAAAQLAQNGSSNTLPNASNLSQSMQSKSSRTYMENHDDGLGVHGKYYRSHNVATANNSTRNVRTYTDIKFDDSDCDEETEMGQESPGSIYSPPFDDVPPNATSGGGASVHPKLPDYDALTARFESLKYRKA